MKRVNRVVMGIFLVLSAIAIQSCASADPQGGGAVFADLEGKDWILSELKKTGNTIPMDRIKLEADNMGGVFTISFSDGQVSGTGAPNRYFGPYTAGENNSISIGNMASTMMMALKEPDGLNEAEYFAYLSKVTHWDLQGGKLELYSADSNGTEAILVFTSN